jgi:hypothetical protein
MQGDLAMIVGGMFLVVVSIYWAVEQRRGAADAAAYREALAESTAQTRESLELQRQANRLLTAIAEKLDGERGSWRME